MATFAPNAPPAGAPASAIVQRMYFSHSLVIDGRGTGLSFTPGGSSDTRHLNPPVLHTSVGVLSSNEAHLVCPQPPRAMRMTHIKPLRLITRPGVPYTVREGSCRFTYMTSQKPNGVTVTVPWGLYNNNLWAGIQAAVLAQQADNINFVSAASDSEILRCTCTTAGATSFSILPARSDKPLMEMLGFLTPNANNLGTPLVHMGNIRTARSSSSEGYLRDLGVFVCLRNSAATTIVTPETMRTQDALALFTYDLSNYASSSTYISLRDNPSPVFLPVNLPLHGADFFLRDSSPDFREIPPICGMSWIFEADVVLVPL